MLEAEEKKVADLVNGMSTEEKMIVIDNLPVEMMLEQISKKYANVMDRMAEISNLLNLR